MPGVARPPFRADHVGSLLRPPALKALRLDREAGRADAAALRAAEDAAIREVVALQEAVDLQGITDGEMRRQSWHMDFLLQLGGWSSQGQRIPVTFHGTAGEVNFTRPDLAITSRVTRPTPIFVDGFRFLKSVVTRTPKLTVPSPCMLYSQVGRSQIDRAVYPDLDAFVEDTGPRSPTSTPPAAAICSSTTSVWPTCATRRCVPRTGPGARTPTPSCGSR
jgi:5-methyltetrahydropteroyltriglutamate--homocysteine methyltransferase